MALDIEISNPQQTAEACVIWMHGLGADANDMKGLAGELQLNKPVRHVFMNAPVRAVTLNNHMPMRAWYDIIGLELNAREDEKGIVESEQLIRDVLESQIEDGFNSEQIFLAGFSQGGAMALYTGLQYEKKLAGIIALSAYLPLADEVLIKQAAETPLFTVFGEFDDLVLPKWSKQSVQWLQSKGMENIYLNSYPMAHAVCLNEIKDLSHWLNSQLKNKESQSGGNA